MGANHGANMSSRDAPQPIHMRRVWWAWVDHDETTLGIPDHIAVGARAGHHAGIGCGESLHMLEQPNRLLGLPIQVMNDLPVSGGQRQFTKRRVMFHETSLLTCQPPRAGTTGEPRLLTCTGLQHTVHGGVCVHALQGPDGGKDDEKIVCAVAFQCILRTNPNRLELLLLIGHRCLVFWHAGYQKWHIKTPVEVTVGDPMRQHKHLVSCQLQAFGLALCKQRLAAVQLLNVLHGHHPTGCVGGQQHTQFFKTLANGRDRLGQSGVILPGPARCDVMHLRICCVDAATGKHIGSRRETRVHGTTRHQHFQASRAIPQQQDGGCRQRGRGWAGRVKLKVRADHGGCVCGCEAMIIGRCGFDSPKCKGLATTLSCWTKPNSPWA